MEVEKSCLLIGNSRWHWAERVSDEWNFVHTCPDLARFQSLENNLVAWASVGSVPSQICLAQNRRMVLEQVPLRNRLQL